MKGPGFSEVMIIPESKIDIEVGAGDVGLVAKITDLGQNFLAAQGKRK